MNSHIENTYEQAVPLWDEAVKKQTVKKILHTIRTEAKVPKLGVMLVGLGGNNGSTFVAGILANKKQTSWETKRGTEHSNFQASFTQCATAHASFQYMKKLVNCKMFSNQLRILCQWSIHVTLKFLDGTF